MWTISSACPWARRERGAGGRQCAERTRRPQSGGRSEFDEPVELDAATVMQRLVQYGDVDGGGERFSAATFSTRNH